MIKKTLIFSILICLSLMGSAVTSAEAKEILNYRFISLNEARAAMPGYSLDYPQETEIPYSRQRLENSPLSWLVPVITDGSPRYLLIQANWQLAGPIENKGDESFGKLLSLAEAKQVIHLLKVLRPNFPNEEESSPPFKYFFRTEELSPPKFGISFQKAINFTEKLLVVDLPSAMQAGLIDSKCISYIEKNAQGKNVMGFEFLPEDFPEITEQNIIVLDLVSFKN